MFNVGGPEILVILLVALVILGPEQLPKAMRTFGNVMAEVRKVSGGFQAEMRKAIESIDDTSSSSTSTTSGTSGTSGSGASSQPKPLATTPEEADITEVVARNLESPHEQADGGATSDAAASVADGDRPHIDPADRAAG